MAYVPTTIYTDPDQETLGAIEVQVDPETGEVITAEPIVIETLPRVARRLLADRHEVAKKVETINREIERLQAIRSLYEQKHAKTEDYLLDVCRRLMMETGQKKLEYPGIGKFRFGVTRPSVNTSAYDAFDEAAQAEVRAKFKDCFRRKIEISPDKKTIKLKLDGGIAVPGFSINEPEDKFEFKEEQ